MNNLKQSLRHNRKDTEYNDCIKELKMSLFLAQEHSLDTDLINSISDLIEDANGFKQSALDDIENGF